MKFDVLFTESARRDFRKLPKAVQKRVVSVLHKVRENPYRYVKRLAGTEWYRIRVGVYRIIVALDDGRIVVLRIAHRKNVYRSLRK